MKLKLWAEVVLFILASLCGLLIFNDSLLVSFIGLVCVLLISIPLARFGRFNDIEKR